MNALCVENQIIPPRRSHLTRSKLCFASHVVPLSAYSGEFIKQSGCLHLSSPLSLPSLFFLSLLSLLVLSCLSYSTVVVSKGRLLGPAMRGLCSATEINAPLGMICLVHVCLADSTLIQGASEHVRDTAAQWRFICLPLHMPGVCFYRLNSRVRG